jgi:hypothetical protein
MKRPKTHFIYFSLSFVIFCIISTQTVTGEVKSTGESDHGYTAPEFTNTVVLAERDALSFDIKSNVNTTANLSLIVYHEAWIINYYPDPKTVTLSATVPVNDPNASDNHVSFGKKSLMEQSLIPNLFYPKKTRVLDKPQIIENRNNTQYSWGTITIDPNNAVIIAYTDDFTDASGIYKGNEIDLPGVRIYREYNESNSSFMMNYSLKNTGTDTLDTANFNVFFPENVNNTQLIEKADVQVNSSCIIDVADKTTYNDGTGYFSKGHMILSNCPHDLVSGDQRDVSITVKGLNLNYGTIFPSIIVNYRVDENMFNTSGSVKRIWPGMNLVSEDNVNVTRFYYYETSVMIPETKYFSVSPEERGTKVDDHTPGGVTQSASLPIIIGVCAVGLGAAIDANYRRN